MCKGTEPDKNQSDGQTLQYVSSRNTHAIERYFQIDLKKEEVNSKIIKYFIWEFLQKLNDFGRNKNVTIYWIPGHVWIKSNEEADSLAKRRPSYFWLDQNCSVEFARALPDKY